MTTTTTVPFATVMDTIDDVEGWMTRAQATRLWDRSTECPPGSTIVEIGSYRGRSAIVLASAAADGVQLVAIDPHGGNDRGPLQWEGEAEQGQEDNDVFNANLEKAGVRHRVRHVRKRSQDALDDVPGTIDLLYIDGAHRYAPALADIVAWGDKVAPGGTMLIHDSFSSIGVTGAQAKVLLLGRRFRYRGRSGSLAEYHREDLDGRAVALNATRQLAELPYLAKNLLIKVLIVLKARPLYRALGNDGQWPY